MSSKYHLFSISGGVYCIRESGLVQDCFTLEKPVIRLLYYKERNYLLTVLEDLTLCQHSVSSDCVLQQLMKV